MNSRDTLKYTVIFLKRLVEKFPQGTIAGNELSKLTELNLYDLTQYVESYAYNEGLDPKDISREMSPEKYEAKPKRYTVKTPLTQEDIAAKPHVKFAIDTGGYNRISQPLSSYRQSPLVDE